MYRAVEAEGPFSTEKRRQSGFNVRKLNEMEKVTTSLKPKTDELSITGVSPHGFLKSFWTDLENAVVVLKRISWSSTMENGVKEDSQFGAIVRPPHKHLWWDQRGRQTPKKGQSTNYSTYLLKSVLSIILPFAPHSFPLLQAPPSIWLQLGETPST